MSFSVDRHNKARRAFGNAEVSREVHAIPLESFNSEIREYSALRNRALVVAGLGGLLAAAWAMGAAGRAPLSARRAVQAVGAGAAIAFTVCRAMLLEREMYDVEYNRELWEIENDLTGEIREMVEIYKAQGLTQDDASVITQIFAKKKKLFANLMMVEELGYSRLQPPPRREILVDVAIPTVIGFSSGCLLPTVTAYTLTRLLDVRANWANVCVMVLCLTVVGMAQLEVYLGAYASNFKILTGVLHNFCAAGITYGIARFVSRLR